MSWCRFWCRFAFRGIQGYSGVLRQERESPPNLLLGGLFDSLADGSPDRKLLEPWRRRLLKQRRVRTAEQVHHVPQVPTSGMDLANHVPSRLFCRTKPGGGRERSNPLRGSRACCRVVNERRQSSRTLLPAPIHSVFISPRLDSFTD